MFYIFLYIYFQKQIKQIFIIFINIQSYEIYLINNNYCISHYTIQTY